MSKSAATPVVLTSDIEAEKHVDQSESTIGYILPRTRQILLTCTMACAGLLNVSFGGFGG